MYRFEELLERIREIGPVDREEISNETKQLNARVKELSELLKPDDLDRYIWREYMNELMAIARRLDELDSLEKAMILYEMETKPGKLIEMIQMLGQYFR